MVDVFDHGEGGSGMVEVFAVGVGCKGGDLLFFEAGPVFVGGLHGRVGSGQGEVGEGGAVGFVLRFDELDGGGGEGVGKVAGAVDHFAVVVEQGVEVAAPMTGGEAVVFVEAAGVGMVGGLGAAVPFAEGSSGVTGVAEDFGDELLVGVDALAACSGGVDAAARIVAAG